MGFWGHQISGRIFIFGLLLFAGFLPSVLANKVASRFCNSAFAGMGSAQDALQIIGAYRSLSMRLSEEQRQRILQSGDPFFSEGLNDSEMSARVQGFQTLKEVIDSRISNEDVRKLLKTELLETLRMFSVADSSGQPPAKQIALAIGAEKEDWQILFDQEEARIRLLMSQADVALAALPRDFNSIAYQIYQNSNWKLVWNEVIFKAGGLGLAVGLSIYTYGHIANGFNSIPAKEFWECLYMSAGFFLTARAVEIGFGSDMEGGLMAISSRGQLVYDYYHSLATMRSRFVDMASRAAAINSQFEEIQNIVDKAFADLDKLADFSRNRIRKLWPVFWANRTLTGMLRLIDYTVGQQRIQILRYQLDRIALLRADFAKSAILPGEQ